MTIPKALQEWVMSRLRAVAARVRTIAKSGRPVELRGYAGAAGEPDYQDPALLMQQYGFRSRPGPGSEAATLPVMGEKTQALIVATEAPGVGPTDQVDWEVEVYAKTGQRLRHLADGSTSIAVPSGASALLKPDGSLTLASGTGGGYAALAGDRLTVNAEVAAERVYVSGSAPSVATANPNVTSATVTRGCDAACEVEIVVAPNPATGTVATLTYSRAWAGAPVVSVAQKGSAEKLNWSATSTTVLLTAAAPGLPAGTYSLVITSTGLL